MVGVIVNKLQHAYPLAIKLLTGAGLGDASRVEDFDGIRRAAESVVDRKRRPGIWHARVQLKLAVYGLKAKYLLEDNAI